MWNFNEVKALAYGRAHVFHVVFDDGLEGDVDFAEYLDKGPVFAPLRDLAFFRSARVANGTISWPNGADIAPETLYARVEAAAKARQRARAVPRKERAAAK